MPWCKRCQNKFDKDPHSIVKHPKVCPRCMRAVERERKKNIKEHYKDNYPKPYFERDKK